MADNQEIFMSPRIDYNSSVAPMSDLESALDLALLEEEFSPIKIGPEKWQCPWIDCPTVLKTRSDVIIHIRGHTGEKPFACPKANCPETFASKSLANRHLRIHTGEKPFHCDQCDLDFVRRYKFNEHMKLHSSKKST